MRFLTLIFAYLTTALNSIGWFIQNSGCGNKINITNIEWQYYTHILLETGVIVLENGTTRCDTNDTVLRDFVNATRSRGKKFIWRDGMTASNLKNVIFNSSWSTYRTNYLNSINSTMIECGLLDDNLSGLEIDYEPLGATELDGYMSVTDTITYGIFMTDLRNAIGPRRSLGFDMGVPGFTIGSFPTMIRPWVPSEVINSPIIDYVNAMSYHWHPAGSILPWVKDVKVFTVNWGIDPSKINLGIPYYNINGTILTGIYNQPLNCNLLESCPNISPLSSTCNGITIVSKQQNYRIGQLAADLGGIMGWSMNYNSITNNNSMIRWSYAGMTGTSVF